MASSISTLMSKIKLERKRTQLASANIARADVEGHTRKVSHTEKNVIQDSISGVKQSEITRVIDKVLQSQVRNQNSNMGQGTTLESYYNSIAQLLGSKGDNASFVHNLNEFALKMNQVSSITDGNKKRETVQQAITLCNQFNQIADHINNLRRQADQELATTINDLNGLMTSMEDLNRQITSLAINKIDTTNLEDERDLVVHKAAELCGIKLYEGDFKNQTLALSNGSILATSTNTFQLHYTQATYVSPGDTLSPITSSTGIDITNTFETGKIAALIKLRDEILPDMQAELDELTRVLRDTTNALHNEAASLGGDPILTGLSYAPGVALPLDGATVISGQGTLRIGITDTEGTLLDYKDVPLTDGMTITTLMNDINTAPYVNGNIAGDFAVTQLATGELQITSTANHSIAVGAAGPVKPTLSPTATYDANQAYGFSHFFGLNNFFNTGNSVASTAQQIGISNALSVRPTIAANANNLSIGRLTSAIPASTGNGLGIAANDSTVALEISDALARGSLSFQAVGVLAAANISANEYATRIMSVVQADIAQSQSAQQVVQRVYDELTTLSQNKSGVDLSEEIMLIFELSTSQNLASKALNIVTTMDKDLIMTLSR